MARLRVLLADDHAMLRDGLAVLINGQADMVVVAQADDGERALQLAREHRPDVAILDVSMPRMGGAEATERMQVECPGVGVIALTRHSDPSYLRRLMQAGAAGFVLKKSAADTLIQAIRTVARGGTYVEPELAGALLQRSFRTGTGEPAAPGNESLTAREEQVLRAVAWGRSSKEIAAQLGISIKTVESYKAAAVEKLGLHSRAEIVRHAMGQGWLSDESAPE